MTTQTTRRALIGGAGLAAIVAMAPAVATVRTPAVSTAKWNALVATFRRADAHMKAIGTEHDAAYKRYQVEADKLGARPEAPDCLRNVYPKPIGEMTLADIKATPVSVSSEYAAYEAALAAWKAKDDALEAAITGNVNARWEAAVDAQEVAAQALFAEPSPNAAALSFKMRLIEESYVGCDLDGEVTMLLFADVRRLLNKDA